MCQGSLDTVGTLTFWGIREPVPGPRWRQLLDATWSGYRGWYVGHGAGARPTLATAADMLDRHMPELVPTWRRLVDIAAGDETAARFLTLYDPPRFLPGCAQVALVDDALALIRNYDYRPDLCERVVYSSAFTRRRVIGSGDCLWGLLDGMNDAGLAVSLTSVTGYPGPPGFGIPLVVRYLLETATTTREACEKATARVRSVIAAASPEDWRDWVLHAIDEAGDEIFVLPFAFVLGKPH